MGIGKLYKLENLRATELAELDRLHAILPRPRRHPARPRARSVGAAGSCRTAPWVSSTIPTARTLLYQRRIASPRWFGNLNVGNGLRITPRPVLTRRFDESTPAQTTASTNRAGTLPTTTTRPSSARGRRRCPASNYVPARRPPRARGIAPLSDPQRLSHLGSPRLGSPYFSFGSPADRRRSRRRGAPAATKGHSYSREPGSAWFCARSQVPEVSSAGGGGAHRRCAGQGDVARG
jgi:hypothetical protein